MLCAALHATAARHTLAAAAQCPEPLAPGPHFAPPQFDAFAKGTFAIANELATMDDCITIIGGGDSVAAVEKAGVADKVRPHGVRQRQR